MCAYVRICAYVCVSVVCVQMCVHVCVVCVFRLGEEVVRMISMMENEV